MRLSDLFRQVSFAQSTGKVLTYLVTLSNAAWGQPIRLAQAKDIVSRGSTYIAGCEIVLPEESREGTRPWHLTAYNANLDLGATLRPVTSEIDALVELIFEDDPDTVILPIKGGRIIAISWTGAFLEADVEWPTLLYLRYPENDFVPTLFPAIFA